jgi:hypothetical protein
MIWCIVYWLWATQGLSWLYRARKRIADCSVQVPIAVCRVQRGGWVGWGEGAPAFWARYIRDIRHVEWVVHLVQSKGQRVDDIVIVVDDIVIVVDDIVIVVHDIVIVVDDIVIVVDLHCVLLVDEWTTQYQPTTPCTMLHKLHCTLLTNPCESERTCLRMNRASAPAAFFLACGIVHPGSHTACGEVGSGEGSW